MGSGMAGSAGSTSSGAGNASSRPAGMATC
jgi:hypothetical protein